MRHIFCMAFRLVVTVVAAAVAAPATADFNGDGRADLAVGVPSEDVGSDTDSGACHIIYGGAGGLVEDDSQYGTQLFLPEGDEPFDGFGASFAIGDFNGDGVPDLAIGIPWEDVGSILNAGAVVVVPGSREWGFLNWLGLTYWTQDEPGVEGTSEDWDVFGHALASGDFNGDGYDDLAVGAPYEDDNATVTTESSGLVHVFMGSASGLRTTDDHQWNQLRAGSELGEYSWFGYALASGDFNGDGYDDLAIGVPGDDVAGMGGRVPSTSCTVTRPGSRRGRATTSGTRIAPELGMWPRRRTSSAGRWRRETSTGTGTTT